jgi:group II intron reverse transcriptase/maturase
MDPLEGMMTRKQSLEAISTKQQRIAEIAAVDSQRALTSLSHHIDLDWLHEAHRQTRKDGAVGIDGQTSTDYAKELDTNLQSLLDQAKTGTYRAPPVRRVHIPKGKGKTRPLGIPTFEDKVLQRAVKMALEPVYEQDFLDCSYGFRPGRSAHDAVEALWQGLMEMGGGWVLEVDIQSYFDAIDHRALRDLLEQRVRDGVLVRLIGKWLRAGVMEEGRHMQPDTGTPQGGVISPILANIYLHEVLDKWFEQEVRPRLRNRSFLVRYADDFIIVFADRQDALRVQTVLAKRFARYGLTLHPEKTRLVRFRKPPRRKQPPEEWEQQRPGSFDFLGFTHFWKRSRRGKWAVGRKTAKDRFTRALKRIAIWCRRNRHRPLKEQHKTLSSKLTGHCQYYGITGNSGALGRFRLMMTRTWRKWLDQRSQNGRMSWERFNRLEARYGLPPAICFHSVYRQAAKPFP